MFKSKKLAVLSALLSLLMLLSLLTVPAFADDAEQTTVPEETEGVTEADESEEDATTDADKDDETTAESNKEETKKEETTTAAGESEAEKQEKKDRLTRSIINLSVGVVLLGVLVFLAIKFRAKIPGWWKSLKSECGKITWCPKDKLKKNVIVVVVIILAIAVVIGVLDFVFSFSMDQLREFVSKLAK